MDSSSGRHALNHYELNNAFNSSASSGFIFSLKINLIWRRRNALSNNFFSSSVSGTICKTGLAFP